MACCIPLWKFSMVCDISYVINRKILTVLDSKSAKKSGSFRKCFDAGIQSIAFLVWQNRWASSKVKKPSSDKIIFLLLCRHQAAAVTLFASTTKKLNVLFWIVTTKLQFISGNWWIISPAGLSTRSNLSDKLVVCRYFQLLADTIKFIPCRFSAHSPSLKLYLYIVSVIVFISLWDSDNIKMRKFFVIDIRLMTIVHTVA